MIPVSRRLEKIEAAGLKRSLTRRFGPCGPRIEIDGREALNLSSNDYLSLAGHPAIAEAASRAVVEYGGGAGASRLVTGNTEVHLKLEERIKKFMDSEAALLFNSGYQANLGVIPALAGRGADIFADKLNHASLIDGALLSRARVHRYPHCDMDALEGMLKKSKAFEKIIITDGVFSMDGDLAPLPQITGLAERYGGVVYLDDAHAAGVLGEHGRGTLEYFNLHGHPLVVRMGTLGKAFGSFGAYVVGSRELIDLLLNTVRTFIYTTALPPSVCAGAIQALDIAEAEPDRRQRVTGNADFLRDGLKKAGLDTLESSTQIIPVLVGSAAETVEISRRLLQRGVFIQAIRPPTVAKNRSRLRITVAAGHTTEELAEALEVVTNVFVK